MSKSAAIIQGWPDDAREPAQLVIDKYGEPDEATESRLLWHDVGPWKRIVATKQVYEHNFPAPHKDSVESFLDYRVPTEFFTPLADSTGA
jgi:hypothetical protein